MKRISVEKILQGLEEMYPNAKTELNFSTPFELLIAVILSAQCTDARVNQVTEKLFKKYQGPEDYAKLTLEELEEDIKECGLFRNKSKNIIATCKILLEKHNGKVPSSFDDLVSLPGVGRKTANVILSNIFNIPAIAVDTHVFRVSNRLGLASSNDVLKTELELQKRIPKDKWSKAHHWLIFHGRRICLARKPKCQLCNIREYCHYYNHVVK